MSVTTEDGKFEITLVSKNVTNSEILEKAKKECEKCITFARGTNNDACGIQSDDCGYEFARAIREEVEGRFKNCESAKNSLNNISEGSVSLLKPKVYLIATVLPMVVLVKIQAIFGRNKSDFLVRGAHEKIAKDFVEHPEYRYFSQRCGVASYCLPVWTHAVKELFEHHENTLVDSENMVDYMFTFIYSICDDAGMPMPLPHKTLREAETQGKVRIQETVEDCLLVFKALRANDNLFARKVLEKVNADPIERGRLYVYEADDGKLSGRWESLEILERNRPPSYEGMFRQYMKLHMTYCSKNYFCVTIRRKEMGYAFFVMRTGELEGIARGDVKNIYAF